VDSIYRSSHN